MHRFDIDYAEKSGEPIKSTTKRSEEEFLDWVRTKGAKVWYFCVFRHEMDRIGKEEGAT